MSFVVFVKLCLKKNCLSIQFVEVIVIIIDCLQNFQQYIFKRLILFSFIFLIFRCSRKLKYLWLHKRRWWLWGLSGIGSVVQAFRISSSHVSHNFLHSLWKWRVFSRRRFWGGEYQYHHKEVWFMFLDIHNRSKTWKYRVSSTFFSQEKWK